MMKNFLLKKGKDKEWITIYSMVKSQWKEERCHTSLINKLNKH